MQIDPHGRAEEAFLWQCVPLTEVVKPPATNHETTIFNYWLAVVILLAKELNPDAL